MALWGSLLLTDSLGAPCPEYIECVHCGAFTRNYLVACTYCHELLIPSSAPSEMELNEDGNINMSGALAVSEFMLHVDRYHPTYSHIDWLSTVFIPSIVLNHNVHAPPPSSYAPQSGNAPTHDAHWVDPVHRADDDTWLHWPHWPQASMVELLMDGGSDGSEWDIHADDIILAGHHGLLEPARDLFVHTVQLQKSVQCAVCLEDVEEGLKLVCAHTYHPACILPWFSNHDTCPTCRESLNCRYRALMRASQT